MLCNIKLSALTVTFYLSDRMALCKLWRSIVLRDEAAMEKYSKALGVKGEAFIFEYILYNCTENLVAPS